MKQKVKELTTLLDLESLEHNLFRGKNLDIGSGSVFGGQVISQALIAAFRTMAQNDQRFCHSLHSYFLRPGDLTTPIVFEVERIRDGKSFSTRRVAAIQHGKTIFYMSASFQEFEAGLEHQAAEAPNVPAPETLTPEFELRQRLVNRKQNPLPESILNPRAIDMRPIDPQDFLKPEPKAPRKQMWFRVADTIADNLPLHQALLAYASDFGLVGTGMMPHGLSFTNPNLQVASIDHSLWFHAPFKADQWLLYDMESPRSNNARNFNRGQIFQQGKLVVSACQEGLMRIRPSD